MGFLKKKICLSKRTNRSRVTTWAIFQNNICPNMVRDCLKNATEFTYKCKSI